MVPKIHDRKAKELNRQADTVPVEVEDPWEPGTKIIVLRQQRGDPLARLHAHRHITESQYHSGRAYQGDWELAEQGPQGIDPTREYVDGGKLADPYSVRRMEARERVKAANITLGADKMKLVQLVLIEGYTVERAATERFRRHGQTWSRYYGTMLRDALETLAVEYGLAMPK